MAIHTTSTALLVIAVLPVSVHAAEPPRAGSIYDPDATHLWNRLHTALFVRTTLDGKSVGHDEVDPLLWPATAHLLRGASHDNAVKLLDEFLTSGGEKLIRDPVKRAVMQHDLWAVFEWSANPQRKHYGAEEFPNARRALQRRLALSVQQLAPRAAAVNDLPDTYAAAVTSKAFAPAFDVEHPETPFLPPDLFDADGPWVCVGGPLDAPGPVALAHAKFHGGRSTFHVVIRLPGNRRATLDYLDRLNAYPTPWGIKPRQENRRDPLELSANIPQFPVGTQVALVRQMILVTEAGTLVPTRITESVQIRVFRNVGTERFTHERGSQAFFEFALNRHRLYAGQRGGLHPVAADKPAYLTLQYLTGAADPFETDQDHRFSMSTMATCASCHTGSGIYSVNSYKRDFSTRPGRQLDLALWPTNADDERKKALEWKQTSYEWGVLHGLLGK